MCLGNCGDIPGASVFHKKCFSLSLRSQGPMHVLADSKEAQIVMRLGGEAGEASYVYDLVQSGRLLYIRA